MCCKLSIVNPVKGRGPNGEKPRGGLAALRGTLRSRSSIVTRRAGFTLLEILIALAIIGGALITILHTVNYHAGLTYEDALSTRMVLMAREKISELELEPMNKKGVLEDKDFSYETIVKKIEDPEDGEAKMISEFLELKAIVRGHGKVVELSELVIKKPDQEIK